MLEFLNEVGDWLMKHVALIGLVLTWAGIALLYWRRRSDWLQKQFADQVNFSLNYVLDGTLAMRTLLESTVKDVWLNEYGVRKVRAAAAQTTVEQPFVLLEEKADHEFINRAVQNVLSERFAGTFVAESLGVPVRVGTFIFGITYERYETMRTMKFRVILMEEQTLVKLFGPGGSGEELRVTNPVFLARLKTLKGLYELYAKDKAAGQASVDRVHLGVPA
jgi:hypothetical protein